MATGHFHLETLVLSSGNLDQLGVGQKAQELFDRIVDDTTRHPGERKLERLAGQQLASADSICSHLEEGYRRESAVECRRYRIRPGSEPECNIGAD